MSKGPWRTNRTGTKYKLAYGEHHKDAKLTADFVAMARANIRAKSGTIASWHAFAMEAFGSISLLAFRNAVTGKTWKTVDTNEPPIAPRPYISRIPIT
jgi:hypothetical protein